jgi:hypothetical protein
MLCEVLPDRLTPQAAEGPQRYELMTRRSQTAGHGVHTAVMFTVKDSAAKPSDIHDLLKIQIESWGRLSELIQLCVKQRDAGDLNISHETFQHAERLRDEITALEEMVKPSTVR